jgi:hypothetical protein
MEVSGLQTTSPGGDGPAAPRFSEDDLVGTGTDVLRALGASEETALVVAKSLSLSNLVGHDSHGIVRLIQYSEWVKSSPVLLQGAAPWPTWTGPGGSVSRPHSSPLR